MNEKVEDITELFGVGMKKGFISTLILLILDENPCHGYKIIDEINKRTLGVWHPKANVIYPLLKTLCDRNLIRSVKQNGTERPKKNLRDYA